MSQTVLIHEFERWFLRRRNASMPPKANLALVADDEGTLKQFGIRITEYLNEVDDPEHGGWFLFDDEVINLLCRRNEKVSDAGGGDVIGEGVLDHVFLNGGAVIVCPVGHLKLPDPGCDVYVLLTGGEAGLDRREGGGRVVDFSRYHAAVNAGRLPGQMVVCLVGDAVLEWAYQLGKAG